MGGKQICQIRELLIFFYIEWTPHPPLNAAPLVYYYCFCTLDLLKHRFYVSSLVHFDDCRVVLWAFDRPQTDLHDLPRVPRPPR